MFDLRVTRGLHSGSVFAFAFACATLTSGRVAAVAEPAPVPVLAAADCRAVDATEAARVLGYPVGSPDAESARSGICFFSTRAVSQEGSVAYAIVGPERLPQRRGFFNAAARRCAGIAKGAPNEAVCRTYARIAQATDLDAYFKARTDYADATPVLFLGDRAVAAPDALYVLRGATIFECVVRRNGAVDSERSEELARLVLERTPQP